jgi:hypothetical protein
MASPIPSPERLFDASAEAYHARKRALLRRVATLDAAGRARFADECARLGAERTGTDLDDPRAMLSRAILAANADTPREDDATHRARGHEVLRQLEDWLLAQVA